MSSSEAIKNGLMQQIRTATNHENARTLIERMSSDCFDRCVPNPGASLTKGEQTCLTQCMDKYMAAWNQVNTTYKRRIQQEYNKQGGV